LGGAWETPSDTGGAQGAAPSAEADFRCRVVHRCGKRGWLAAGAAAGPGLAAGVPCRAGVQRLVVKHGHAPAWSEGGPLRWLPSQQRPVLVAPGQHGWSHGRLGLPGLAGSQGVFECMAWALGA